MKKDLVEIILGMLMGIVIVITFIFFVAWINNPSNYPFLAIGIIGIVVLIYLYITVTK